MPEVSSLGGDYWRNFYDGYAGQYDSEKVDGSAEAHAVLALADITSSDRGVLDLGCGTGQFLLAAQRQAREKGHHNLRLLSVDFAQGMVNQAKSKVAALTQPNVGIIKDDISTLNVMRAIIERQFPYGISVITVLNVDHFLTPEVLATSIRLWVSLLNDGGRLVISHSHSQPTWHNASGDQLHGMIHWTRPTPSGDRLQATVNVAPPSLYDAAAQEMRSLVQGLDLGVDFQYLSYPTAIGNAPFRYNNNASQEVVMRDEGEAYGQYLYRAAVKLVEKFPILNAASEHDEWVLHRRNLGRAITCANDVDVVAFKDVTVEAWIAMEHRATLYAQVTIGQGYVVQGQSKAMDRYVHAGLHEICRMPSGSGA